MVVKFPILLLVITLLGCGSHGGDMDISCDIFTNPESYVGNNIIVKVLIFYDEGPKIIKPLKCQADMTLIPVELGSMEQEDIRTLQLSRNDSNEAILYGNSADLTGILKWSDDQIYVGYYFEFETIKINHRLDITENYKSVINDLPN